MNRFGEKNKIILAENKQKKNNKNVVIVVSCLKKVILNSQGANFRMMRERSLIIL